MPATASQSRRFGCHGQVAEHEQQLGRQDGLYQAKLPEVQSSQLEHEPADHGGDAQQPGRLAGEPDDEPGIEPARGRTGVPGPGALAHRRRRGAQARCERQQDRLLHQSPPPGAIMTLAFQPRPAAPMVPPAGSWWGFPPERRM